MYTPPDDLSDDDVAAALREQWRIDVDEIAYLPVGFGSHHWTVSSGHSRWFATVDDLRMGERGAETVQAALEAAFRLHAAGLAFVVAPVRTRSDRCTHSLTAHHLLAVYPFIDATSAVGLSFDDHRMRVDVVDMLVQVHCSPTSLSAGLPHEGLRLPCRVQLATALSRLDQTWSTGPFAEPTRALLRANSAELANALERFDAQARRWSAATDRMVFTHGEPHCGNTMTSDGVVRLIDWETARVAHPERDLWRIAREDPSMVGYYEQAAGRGLEPELLDLYALWWDLSDVALYVADFTAPHPDTEDNRVGWQGLVEHLDPRRWS